MTALIRYEQARNALAECVSVDEVKDLRDKAEAMAAYARVAKDPDLVLWATEIKVRAERKAGEMLIEAKERGERAQVGKPPADANARTLRELGIEAHRATRWQQLASIPEEYFETAVATAKESAGQVTSAFLLREAAKRRNPEPKPVRGNRRTTKADQERLEEMNRQRAAGISVVTVYASRLLAAMRSQSTFTEEERAALAEVCAAFQSASTTTEG